MTTRKRKSKRLERGAALIEGMLVAITLAALLGFGAYLHRSYVAKLSSGQHAAFVTSSKPGADCEQDSDLAAIERELLSRKVLTNPEALALRTPPCSAPPRFGGARREALRKDLLHRLLPSFE